MKYLLLLTALFLQTTANSQVYINLEIVNGVATFQGEAEAPNMQEGDLNQLTIEWLDETFPDEDVLTLNTKTKISAKYSADYTIQSNQATFKHDLQIDLIQGKATFTITDRSIKLIHANGDWKKHLTELRIEFEKGCNELLWSYSKYIKEQKVKE